MKTWIFDSKLEEYPNQEWIGIHTRAPLCSRTGYYSAGLDKKEDLPILTIALIEAIESLLGVREVSCQRHKIGIRRSMAYTWDQILAAAGPAFVSYCPATY